MKDKYEKLLNIKTAEDPFTLLPSVVQYNQYEPTNYEALEALIREYKITADDYVVDFGSGKGRLNFFLNYYTDASVLGIEMDERFIETALWNRSNYAKEYPKKAEKVAFRACLAEQYPINKKDNVFYFFNPFAIQIFRKVIHRILGSAVEFPRTIDLILFYPYGDYIHFIEYETPFNLVQEIKIAGFYEKDQNERFLIYRWEA